MIKKNISAVDVEQVQFNLHCATEIIGAIHHAEEVGDFEPGSFHDALFGAYWYLSILVKDMKNLYEDVEKHI